MSNILRVGQNGRPPRQGCPTLSASNTASLPAAGKSLAYHIQLFRCTSSLHLVAPTFQCPLAHPGHFAHQMGSNPTRRLFMAPVGPQSQVTGHLAPPHHPSEAELRTWHPGLASEGDVSVISVQGIGMWLSGRRQSFYMRLASVTACPVMKAPLAIGTSWRNGLSSRGPSFSQLWDARDTHMQRSSERST
ncbi:hypothetical protein EJ06DRAFT_267270 [Trichodelitschia bisporula]|uniref:Uncharacterized protein n=1 Tax=Trichodelitschia bisporula TaxID=703511 RepID=A0A6G1HHX4_9PEZI|nr:hypothetical protein EJ06DRAFT_267270 [Trichodelitschia bisporula]